MLIKIKGSSIIGIEATLITIEINVSMGQGYGIVGLPDIAIKESLDRTESAIKANGYHMPLTKVLINLSPADIRKTGTAFDLPIAIGLIAASEQLETILPLDQLLIMGELGLDGLINPIKGALAMAIKAKAENLSALIIPIENIKEASIIEGIPIFGFRRLKEVVEFIINGSLQPQVHNKYIRPSINIASTITLPRIEEVKGQLHGKRALEIASAGAHNLIKIGNNYTTLNKLSKNCI